MRQNRHKKGILLFEVMVAAILVSIISLFLFRAYGTFIRAAKKSTDYLKLILFSEQKVYELSVLEKSGQITNTTQLEGGLDFQYKWFLYLKDTDYGRLKQAKIKITNGSGSKSFDTVMYLTGQEE